MLKGNVFVLGGDKRSLYAAEYFETAGYKTSACVTELAQGYEKLLGGADLIFLGLPAVVNGRVNMPLSNVEVSFSELLRLCKKDAVLSGGRLSAEERGLAENVGLKWLDYSEDEVFQLENALYTAEGTIAALVQSTDRSLWGMKILITGGGRISRALLSLLSGAPCNICVYARRKEQRSVFELWGADTCDLVESLGGFDVVINTVPADILPFDVLRTAGKDTLIIDLSARPGYVNKDICRDLGLKLMYLPGIPLTSAPRSAGISAAMAAERMSDLTYGVH